MAIKVIGIDASPRKNSNSGALLQHAFDKARAEFGTDFTGEILHLRDYAFDHCLACGVCGKRKDSEEFIPCVRKDDMNIILDKLCGADGIAVATPVYFGLASDLFSKFIMRTRLLRHQNFKLANKPVAVMATAGRRSGGAETTIVSTWLPFIRHGCLIVGNGDKTSQYGTMAWGGACGHVMSDEWGLVQAEDTVRRIYDIARLIQAGSAALNYQNPMNFSYTSGNRS